MDPKALEKIACGLFVLTAREGGKDNGCIVNTLMQVTNDPLRVAFAVDKGNYTHGMILRTSRAAVSLLSEKAEWSLFEAFGFVSGKDTDKFSPVASKWMAAHEADCPRTAGGIRTVRAGANAVLALEVESATDLGTHTLFVCRVEEAEVLDETPSATYAYYHAKIKPAAKEAPKVPAGQHVWRCKICGWEYVGETLPADIICPLCKHPASDFVLVS